MIHANSGTTQAANELLGPLVDEFQRHLYFTMGHHLDDAAKSYLYFALAHAIRDRLTGFWCETQKKIRN